MPIKGVRAGQPRQDPFQETVIWDIVPERTALIIIDMQNFFVDERGRGYCIGTQEAVPRMNKLARVCRDHGIAGIWVRNLHSPGGLEMGYEREFFPLEFKEKDGFAEEGTWNAEFYPKLDIKKGDLIVTKRRYSAFVPGASNLDRILRYMGKDTVIITGCATNVCCGTNAMVAMMLDYKVIFVSDANIASGELTPEGFGPGLVQEAYLRSLRAYFAMVCTTDELIGEIQKTAKK